MSSWRIRVVWIVKRISTKKILKVYTTKYLAVQHCNDDPSVELERFDLN